MGSASGRAVILTSSCSANAAITDAKDIVGIDDPAEGVALVRLQDGARVRTFPVPVRKSCRPRQVAFAEEGKVVVCGSDHGKVYVFDRRTGGKIDELHVDQEDWVQTLTVSGGAVIRVLLKGWIDCIPQGESLHSGGSISRVGRASPNFHLGKRREGVDYHPKPSKFWAARFGFYDISYRMLHLSEPSNSSERSSSQRKNLSLLTLVVFQMPLIAKSATWVHNIISLVLSYL